MNAFQKTIKYLAIAFAILLTVGIMSGIVGVISGVVSVFSVDDERNIDYSEDFTDVERLDISNGLGSLDIKPGNGFRVEASNVSKSFRAEVVNGTLVVGESDFFGRIFSFGFRSRSKSSITVYVPKDFYAKRIKIECGLGAVNLESLSTERLIVDAGVGDLNATDLTAMRVDIDGGVGNINLNNINFTNVDLDCGVGDINIDGVILGKSEFDGGLGSVNIRINGPRKDYALELSTGIGRIEVNGEKINHDYNDNYRADNTIKIDGGVGGISIAFTQ